MHDPTTRRERVAAVIPAFQEAGRIGPVVKSVLADCELHACIVVDDGSTDSTSREANLAGAEVIALPFNTGYGAALQTGIRYAYQKGYDLVVSLDGDGQHLVESVSCLLTKIREGQHDLIVGSRFLGPEAYHLGWGRLSGIIFFRWLLRLLSGLKISDPTSGFLVMNRPAMRFCISDWYPTDFPDANALFMMSRAGLRIGEAPVTMEVRQGGSSMHSGLRPLTYVYKVCLSIGVTTFRKIPRNWLEH